MPLIWQATPSMLRISNPITAQRANYSSNSGLLSIQAEAISLGIPCSIGAQDGMFVVELSLQCRLSAKPQLSGKEAVKLAYEPAEATAEHDEYGIGEFAWLLVEDNPTVAHLLTALMTKVGVKHHKTVRTAEDVQHFVKTAVSFASHAHSSLNLRTICLMDEHLTSLENGHEVDITGTELRKQLLADTAANQASSHATLYHCVIAYTPHVTSAHRHLALSCSPVAAGGGGFDSNDSNIWFCA